jgi:hypothetical protein
MLTRFLTIFAVFLALAWSAVPVGAKETFKDEAGRVIYIIGDDGIVTMYENSSTDTTLSIKRGLREQMNPSLSEVVPDTVAAGSSFILKLRGKNLVGAKVTLGAPKIEIGESVGFPETAEVPIHVPADFPPGDVAINVATPIGRTVSTFKVTSPLQKQSNGTPSGNSEGKPAIPTEAPLSCPEGMVGVAAERGGFCIEIDQTFSGTLRQAEKACAMTGKRLCAAAEWSAACEQASKNQLALKNILGNWEWTSSTGRGFGLTSVLLGQADCATERLHPPWKSETIPGRCCK